jgi:signal transduction histidine kinase
MASIKQQVNSQLVNLKLANQALYELTVELNLLNAISNMTVNVSAALEILSKQNKNSTDDNLVALLADSDAIEILDEIVDNDCMSELENHFFTAIDNMEDNIMGDFLSELIEKIELRYTALISAIHELNALLNKSTLAS